MTAVADRAPDWVADGTPEPLRSELVAALGAEQVLPEPSIWSGTPQTRAHIG